MRCVIVLLVLLLNINYLYGKNGFLPESIYLISNNNVNVREKPDLKSKAIIKLNIADRVKLIKRSGLKFKNNDIEGEWVYIDTRKNKNYYNNDTYKGWIIDYYLVGDDQFNVVNKFYNIKLVGYYGDSYINFEFYENGSYRQKYYDPSIGEREKDSKSYYGQLYYYKNIFITKLYHGIGIFYILDKKICAAYTDICAEIK